MDREDSFYAVQNPGDSVPHLGSDDEDSFVVLETGPSLNDNSGPPSVMEEVLPPLRTNKVHEMQSLIKMKLSQINSEPMPELPPAVDAIDAVPSSVPKINISPDSSYEEIQKQVEELIKENETLKNTVTQNNMSMKTQYGRFVGYKDEVTKVMKSYRDKFNEAKVCVDKLKEENAKLANDVEVYISIKKLHEEEIINLKDKLRGFDSKSDDNSPERDTKIADLQTALAESGIKNNELIEENNKLKQEINNLQEENSKLTEKLVFLPKLQEELQNVKAENTDLQLKLTDIIEKHKKREKEFVDQLAALRKENDDLQLTLKATAKESEKLVQSSNYQEQLKSKDSEIVKLKQEIETITFSENTLKDQVKSLKLRLSDLQASYNPRLEEEYTQARSQLSFAQETITSLEQERERRVQEVEDLRNLLQESSAKNDEMFALREQVELFKTDFEAEKESKVAIKREKDQLAEDIQNLQKRNQQLQNQIETLIARDQPRAEGYTCPKCSFGFYTYQSLENHVHRCLDLEGFP